MATFVIKYNREGCIGAASCTAVDPISWKLEPDNKVDLEGAQKNDDNTEQTKEINEDELKVYLEAAQACPVNVIHIFNKETGEKLI
jgi:ferredoxin